MNGCRVIALLLLLAYSLLLVMAISGCATEEATPQLEIETVEEEPDPEIDQEIETVEEEPEPDPGIDQEIEAELDVDTNYPEKLAENVLRMREAIEQFSRQLREAELTEEWVDETMVILETMQVLIEEVRNLDPPDEFIELHEVYLKAIDKFEEGIIYNMEGISEFDSDLVDKGSRKFIEGLPYTEEAMDILLEIL